MSVNWVNSGGGPLICTSPIAATNWRGINGNSIGDSLRTDYERACDEFEYLGVILSNALEVLVLGDEPLQTAFVVIDNKTLIARWISCISLKRAEQALASIPEQLPKIGTEVQFVTQEPILCLFDSALDKPQVTESRLCCVDFKPSHYIVTSESYKREKEFEFLVHRFLNKER